MADVARKRIFPDTQRPAREEDIISIDGRRMIPSKGHRLKRLVRFERPDERLNIFKRLGQTRYALAECPLEPCGNVCRGIVLLVKKEKPGLARGEQRAPDMAIDTYESHRC